MKHLQIVIDKVNPRFTRTYKGGVELRGINLENDRELIQKIIQDNALPVEIFDIDISLKSISIREISS